MIPMHHRYEKINKNKTCVNDNFKIPKKFDKIERDTENESMNIFAQVRFSIRWEIVTYEKIESIPFE
jgi:hypothetical protein